MKRALWLLIIFSQFGLIKSQSIVNAYARVSAVSNNSVITLTNVNETNHTFQVGQQILILQMQDDVIGTNTTNASSFGNLGAIANAGRLEAKTILSKSPASGTPTQITVASPFSYTWNTGTNSALQIVTFRNLGTNFTTTANITSAAWDGSVGGVVAIEVTNTLTLAHSITTNTLGFRGGTVSASADETCTNTVYITNSNLKAYKGEGIYKNTNANFTNGRGKILSGGGGGAQNNSGGGGGGNWTAGGDGGVGYQCTAANSGYGIGGLSFSTSISGTRFFMGGGGGGGQANNNNGTDGGNGGGIILIKATSIQTGTTCAASISITANGESVGSSGNDGGGGGGAGGSIVIQASSFSISATCPLTVSANGGDGGDVGNGTTHGGGGGGGQGVVIYSLAQPTTNVTTQAINGAGGLNNNTGSGGSASSGSGTNGSGVSGGGSTILPVELVAFWAEHLKEQGVKLKWKTASEKNTREFVVERSTDAVNFVAIKTLPAAFNSSSYLSYETLDSEHPSGTVYYRLRTIDMDESFSLSSIIVVVTSPIYEIKIQPNPVSKNEKLTIGFGGLPLSGAEFIALYDLYGRLVYSTAATKDQVSISVDVASLELPTGVYMMSVSDGAERLVRKIVIE